MMVKLVFTNGCFDILHRGHLELLKHCRRLGGDTGWVTVGINSDASIQRLKGTSRPIVSQDDRRAILEELSCVDEVTIFDEDTPYELMKRIKPDIIVKGGDYEIENVVGSDLADVVIFNFLDGYSTTSMIEKMNDKKEHDGH